MPNLIKYLINANYILKTLGHELAHKGGKLHTLFKKKLIRQELLALEPPHNYRRIKITIHRNHSFELVASVLNPFLALAGLQAEFYYSAYDDSLSFTDIPHNTDVHILWLDMSSV